MHVFGGHGMFGSVCVCVGVWCIWGIGMCRGLSMYLERSVCIWGLHVQGALSVFWGYVCLESCMGLGGLCVFWTTCLLGTFVWRDPHVFEGDPCVWEIYVCFKHLCILRGSALFGGLLVWGISLPSSVHLRNGLSSRPPIP